MVNPNFVDLVFRVPFSVQDSILIEIAKKLRRMNFEIDSVLESEDNDDVKFVAFRLRPVDGRRLGHTWALVIQKMGEGTGILGAVRWEIGVWGGRNKRIGNEKT